ncbi:MAG TPA: endonuclease/exonuclease/phosphatase family protein [Vicinamibacterales bacterium]|nr:endonuclease/exonuclease/phosphatase family protein [Vicinamibacterales bacterium]
MGVLAAAAGCASPALVPLVALPNPPCAGAAGIDWFGPAGSGDRGRLAAWCDAAGPPAVVEPPARPARADRDTATLAIVTWNIHEGAGDLHALVDWIRQRAGGEADVVVMLQEAMRRGDGVPPDVPAGAHSPRRIAPSPVPAPGIAAAAAREGLWTAYVPSMRNGGQGGSDREDRGCAVLSSLPITAVRAIELPWVSQRRVAVAATIEARREGRSWPLTAVSVHLDNRPGRGVQAAALARLLGSLQGSGPMMVGGDLNTWWGRRERAVSEIDRVVPLAAACEGRATFRFGRRLDHLFTSLPAASRARCEIPAGSFGSDHRPVVLFAGPGSLSGRARSGGSG